jgi:malate synthase
VHPQAGANTAWVPSPTAATLHALHYHQVDVFKVQKSLEKTNVDAEREAILEGLLTVPVVKKAKWSDAEKRQELDNNAPGHPGLRGALGRPGRGLLQGARHPQRRPDGRPRHAAHQQPAHRQLAAARRGRQGEVKKTLKRMAKVVDQQNAGDPLYLPMAGMRRARPPSRPRATWSSRAWSSPAATPSRCCMRGG